MSIDWKTQVGWAKHALGHHEDNDALPLSWTEHKDLGVKIFRQRGLRYGVCNYIHLMSLILGESPTEITGLPRKLAHECLFGGETAPEGATYVDIGVAQKETPTTWAAEKLGVTPAVIYLAQGIPDSWDYIIRWGQETPLSLYQERYIGIDQWHATIPPLLYCSCSEGVLPAVTFKGRVQRHNQRRRHDQVRLDNEDLLAAIRPGQSYSELHEALSTRGRKKFLKMMGDKFTHGPGVFVPEEHRLLSVEEQKQLGVKELVSRKDVWEHSQKVRNCLYNEYLYKLENHTEYAAFELPGGGTLLLEAVDGYSAWAVNEYAGTQGKPLNDEQRMAMELVLMYANN